VHVDENLTQPAVHIFAGPQIHLVPADDSLLRIALAPFRQLFAVGADHFLDDDAFHDLFGQHGGLFLRGPCRKDLLRLLVILDQGRSQRLRQFRPVAVQRIRLDAQRPRQFVSRQRVLNGRRVCHVDRLGNRARDKGLRRRHHVDMALHRQIALADLAAGIGAVEHRIMLLLQEGRAFQRHGADDVVIRRLNLRPGEPQMLQQVKGRVHQLVRRNTQGALAEILAQRPLVEHKADVKGRGELAFDLFNLTRAKAVAHQAGGVDAGAVAHRPVADRIGDHFGNLCGPIAQLFQRRRDRLVDDLEIAAARQFLELDQGKIRLDPGRVAVHHQPDGAGGGDHGGLGVAKAVQLAQRQSLVPGHLGQFDQRQVGAIAQVQGDRGDVQPFIAARLAIGRIAVVADHPQHMGRIAGMAGEGTQLPRHLGAGGIGDAGHDRGQGATQGTPLTAVIAKTHVHQQPADIGIAKTQGAEIIRQLCNFLGRELRHHHRNFQRHGPKTRGVDIAFGVKLAAVVERQQVHAGQIAGGVIQEHVFRTWVRSADRAIFRAGVPGVDGVVKLDAGVGTGPGGVADLVPQFARLDLSGDLAIGAADQFPRQVVLDRLQERIRHPDRVVRVLP